MLELDLYTLIVNMVNSLLPFAFSGLLYSNYVRRKRRFYLLWLIGFLAYGVSNLINVYNVYYGVTSISGLYLLFLFTMIAFSSFLTGIGDLIGQTRMAFLSSFGAPVIFVVLYIAGAPVDAFNLFFLLPYIIITGALLALKRRYAVEINEAILGFLIILLANVGYTLGEVSISIAPLFSILGKFILFYWMTKPRFSSLAEDLESFMIESSSHSGMAHSNLVYVVEVGSINGVNDWIKQRFNERLSPETRSILILLDNQLTMGSLRHSGLLDESELFIIKSVYGFHKLEDVFAERYMEVSRDINDLSVLLADMLAFIERNNIKTQLFFYDLSSLIAAEGWKRVYSFLIALIPQLKSKQVQTYFIYTPIDKIPAYEKEILKHLGDQTIVLNG